MPRQTDLTSTTDPPVGTTAPFLTRAAGVPSPPFRVRTGPVA
jgi:hypothetical protein